MRDFDSLFQEIKEGIEQYCLDPKPPMFEKDPDHTCLTYYHKSKLSEEDKMRVSMEKKREAAAELIAFLVENDMLSTLSVCQKQGIPRTEYKTLD